MKELSTQKTEKMNEIFSGHYREAGEDFYSKKINGAEYRFKSAKTEFETQSFKSLPAFINAFSRTMSLFDIIFTSFLILISFCMLSGLILLILGSALFFLGINSFNFTEAFSLCSFISLVIFFMIREETVKTMLYAEAEEELEDLQWSYKTFKEEVSRLETGHFTDLSYFTLEDSFASNDLLKEISPYIPKSMFNKLILKSVENNEYGVLLSDLYELIIKINKITKANQITDGFYK